MFSKDFAMLKILESGPKPNNLRRDKYDSDKTSPAKEIAKL